MKGQRDTQEMSRPSEDTEDGDCTGSVTLKFGQYLAGTGLRLRTSSEFMESLFQNSSDFEGGPIPPEVRDVISPTITRAFQHIGGRITPSVEYVNRWKHYWRFHVLCPSLNLAHLRYTKFLIQRFQNWPSTSEIKDDWFAQSGFCAATATYGGLHLLAWFAHFDTFAEQLLWRVSACTVVGGLPAVCILWNTSGVRYFRTQKPWKEYLSNIVNDLAPIGIRYLILPAYILARTYLVVECFINLSHLPADVYTLPTWSTYFPHIS